MLDRERARMVAATHRWCCPGSSTAGCAAQLLRPVCCSREGGMLAGSLRPASRFACLKSGAPPRISRLSLPAGCGSTP